MTRLAELLVSLFFLLNVAGCSATGTQQAPPPIELRGLWLADEHIFASRQKIADAMQFLADHNFNAVLPVVWNGARTLHPSKVMEQWFGVSAATAHRDVLAELIEEAHKRGLAVIPTVTLSVAPNPSFSETLAKTKPQWLARDRAGNPVRKDDIEWLNPLHPEVQEFLLALVSEVAKSYDVDGILGGDRLLAEPIEAGY
ncbi:MAG TPA: family 10 glycosylhydrolase, partial [Bacteroidota bacterium]|nr:family 10 glycosylhydrolase [Bacteroidota bacterium]